MESAMKGNKIMLVDDESDITMAFKLTLQDAGFTVDTYEDPLVALSEFKPRYYDLVILDIKMTKMNGFELYAKMQKIDEQVRVCFITAGEMYYDEFRNERQDGQEEELEEELEGVKQQYCKLNPDRFLQKPISNVDLVRSIEKILMLNKSPNIVNT